MSVPLARIGRVMAYRAPRHKAAWALWTRAVRGGSMGEMTTRNDLESWLARMAMGDRDALSRLYAATSAKLLGVAIRVLGDRAEAEDALQEVYMKVWRHAGRYQVNGLSPMTWLIAIARNHAVDRLRARRGPGHTSLDDALELADLGPDPETSAAAAGDRARIVACLAALEPDRAEAVRRCYLEGDSYADLATHYGIPLNTIRTWLRRSLLKLRDCLA